MIPIHVSSLLEILLNGTASLDLGDRLDIIALLVLHLELQLLFQPLYGDALLLPPAELYGCTWRTCIPF